MTTVKQCTRAAWGCILAMLALGLGGCATYDVHVNGFAGNVTNPGKVTTREVAELIRRSGVCTKEFSYFASEAEFMSTAAKTPRSNCVLDPSKLAGAGIRLTPVLEAIERALGAWNQAA